MMVRSSRPCSMSKDLARTTSQAYSGEALIACRNPALVGDPRRHPRRALARTEKLLGPIHALNQVGGLRGAGPIGVEEGKVIDQVQDGLGLRRHDHRNQPGPPAQAGRDRRRSWGGRG